MINIEEYKQEKTCAYKEEAYLVRDNGAVMRLPKEGKKARALDNKWTFGTKGKNGYMTISSHRVHIIVATAFHGPKDSKVYVVDHIDTNRCNNRPENLRWLTKLENVLVNPFTRAKIEYICGSVEAFLNDPSILHNHPLLSKDMEWMRTVSKEEAANTLKNLKNLSLRPANTISSSGLGEWLFAPSELEADVLDDELVNKKTTSEPPTEKKKRKRTSRTESNITMGIDSSDYTPREMITPEQVFVDGEAKVKAIKVRFIKESCYLCGEDFYVYLITGVVTNTGIKLDTMEQLCDAEVHIDTFNPIVISAVKKYLTQHPELNYPMGEIKERNSRTMDKSYMSFGCAKCDSLYGDWHLHELYMEFIYEEDDGESTYLIELEGEELIVKRECKDF